MTLPVHGARKDDEDILAGRQIVAHVIQDGLAEAARVNAGGYADPVIAGQVAGTCFGDVQKLNIFRIRCSDPKRVSVDPHCVLRVVAACVRAEQLLRVCNCVIDDCRIY